MKRLALIKPVPAAVVVEMPCPVCRSPKHPRLPCKLCLALDRLKRTVRHGLANGRGEVVEV